MIKIICKKVFSLVFVFPSHILTEANVKFGVKMFIGITEFEIFKVYGTS
jgi:hypothetical protein